MVTVPLSIADGHSLWLFTVRQPFPNVGLFFVKASTPCSIHGGDRPLARASRRPLLAAYV